ncbi:MAG: DUF4169 family protein [Pseudomonadota bacterium]
MAKSLINLNKARKARHRADETQLAKENRAKFGQIGADRRAQDKRLDKEMKRLDDHKLEED